MGKISSICHLLKLDQCMVSVNSGSFLSFVSRRSMLIQLITDYFGRKPITTINYTEMIENMLNLED